MKCAECQCSPIDYRNLECSICTKDVCCSVPRKEHLIYRFFQNASKLYATALAIGVLCICAAEIAKKNSSYVIFGYRTVIGITLGYIGIEPKPLTKEALANLKKIKESLAQLPEDENVRIQRQSID